MSKATLFEIVNSVESTTEFAQKDILSTIFYLIDCIDSESYAKRIVEYAEDLNADLADEKRYIAEINS